MLRIISRDMTIKNFRLSFSWLFYAVNIDIIRGIYSIIFRAVKCKEKKQVTTRKRDFLLQNDFKIYFSSAVKFIFSFRCRMRLESSDREHNCHTKQKGVLGAFFSWAREREKIHKVFQMYDESRTNVPATYSVNHVSVFLFCALTVPYSTQNLQYIII